MYRYVWISSEDIPSLAKVEISSQNLTVEITLSKHITQESLYNNIPNYLEPIVKFGESNVVNGRASGGHCQPLGRAARPRDLGHEADEAVEAQPGAVFL